MSMRVQHLPFLLQRANDRDIHGTWHLPEDLPAKGTVLFLHGYKGYMDWGAWNQVGDQMALSGWRFLRINFTHNGTTPDAPSAFADLEAFGRNTHRRERDEALAVLCALREPGPVGHPNPTAQGPLAVVGHSRGGGMAVLAAAQGDTMLRHESAEGVTHLITWAAVADFKSRFPGPETRQLWEQTGQLEVINHRTRQRMYHNWTFYTDFLAHEKELNIESAIRSFGGRTFIAHAEDDAAVDVEHALQLSVWAQDPTLLLMEEGGHTFGASEPWTSPALPPILEGLTQTTLRFLEEGRVVGDSLE